MIARDSETRRIHLGSVPVGGGSPVTVQSMTNTGTHDLIATLRQIKQLSKAGCEIVRVAVPDMAAADTLGEIASSSPIPVIADIHFDYRLALVAIASGVHGIRINPGNIGDKSKVRLIAEAAGKKGIPIRVGANSGSLPGKYSRKIRPGMPRHDEFLSIALVESALAECRLLEKYGFSRIKVSLKASGVPATVMAYRRFSQESDYPLHLGITEAGTLFRGTVKSAVGIGALLLEGIGDTIRVSLTANPVEEVKTGIMILESTGLRQATPEIVSCPTCGRTGIDLIGLTRKVEREIEAIKKSGRRIGPVKIAVMGCAVNGPGEARDADIGIAGAKKGKFVLFRKGRAAGVFSEEKALEVLKMELDRRA